eukprot:scaffold119540_cov66-Phaeocystis_antarctica.AAC.3
MSWVYRRAGLAMLITSLTTCAAFVATAASSPIPTLQNFGIFAAGVILIDYALVMTFLCSGVVIYHNMFEMKAGICCACCTFAAEDSTVDFMLCSAKKNGGCGRICSFSGLTTSTDIAREGGVATAQGKKTFLVRFFEVNTQARYLSFQSYHQAREGARLLHRLVRGHLYPCDVRRYQTGASDKRRAVSSRIAPLSALRHRLQLFPCIQPGRDRLDADRLRLQRRRTDESRWRQSSLQPGALVAATWSLHIPDMTLASCALDTCCSCVPYHAGQQGQGRLPRRLRAHC